MKTLKELEAEKEKLVIRVRKLNYKIQDSIESKEIPRLKKKYENTYWKVVNRFSSDECWWLYTKVLKITSNSFSYPHANTISFQTDSNGRVEFKAEERMWVTDRERTKITKKEFDREFNKRIRKLTKQF